MERLHAPNEFFRIRRLGEGMRAGEALWRLLAAWQTPWRDAILQPPKPHIFPSPRIPQRAAEHDIEPEAAG